MRANSIARDPAALLQLWRGHSAIAALQRAHVTSCSNEEWRNRGGATAATAELMTTSQLFCSSRTATTVAPVIFSSSR